MISHVAICVHGSKLAEHFVWATEMFCCATLGRFTAVSI
jgi:hypothetical protein